MQFSGIKQQTKFIRMKNNIFCILSLMMVGFIFLVSCLDDDEEKSVENKTRELLLSVNGLPHLDEFHGYEGWILVDGSLVSTGKFTISESGLLSDSVFMVDEGQLESASEFVITIEPMPDPDDAPTAVHILAGTFIGSNASLSFAHSSAIGTGFSGATGKFILATPTDGQNTNELSGVWWLDPSGPSKSLVLPALADGWLYEGWVIINGQPLSTGKFESPDMADQSNPYSATLEAPNFPGEDLLANSPAGLSFPLDLSDENVAISVEPDPDNSNIPFVIKPLLGVIPGSPLDHTLYNMVNNADGFSISGIAKK